MLIGACNPMLPPILKFACSGLSAQKAGGAYPQAADLIAMEPCGSGRALSFKLGPDGELKILSHVPVAAPVCVGAPPPPPNPPPGRPSHYFSCTAGLRGGPRLSFPFCNASLPEVVRIADLLSRATCAEKVRHNVDIIIASGAHVSRIFLRVATPQARRGVPCSS